MRGRVKNQKGANKHLNGGDFEVLEITGASIISFLPSDNSVTKVALHPSKGGVRIFLHIKNNVAEFSRHDVELFERGGLI